MDTCKTTNCTNTIDLPPGGGSPRTKFTRCRGCRRIERNNGHAEQRLITLSRDLRPYERAAVSHLASLDATSRQQFLDIATNLKLGHYKNIDPDTPVGSQYGMASEVNQTKVRKATMAALANRTPQKLLVLYLKFHLFEVTQPHAFCPLPEFHDYVVFAQAGRTFAGSPRKAHSPFDGSRNGSATRAAFGCIILRDLAILGSTSDRLIASLTDVARAPAWNASAEQLRRAKEGKRTATLASLDAHEPRTTIGAKGHSRKHQPVQIVYAGAPPPVAPKKPTLSSRMPSSKFM